MEELRKIAYEAGFDALAITTAKPLEHMKKRLETAQQEDRYPEFVTDDIISRIDPRTHMDSVQSIISLAICYNTGNPGPTPHMHGTVARAAWGKDYHNVFAERFTKLIPYLKSRFGVKEFTMAVDTSPLIDRAIAIEAGLGISGENCAVYIPPFGSWVFLGELLVDVKLPSNSPTTIDPSYGQCHGACVRACPTGALISPGKINPHLCISYLTQKSGSIPHKLRSKIGNRLWGCDTCQQASAVNRTAHLSRHPEFKPLVGPHIPLISLLTMNKQEFTHMFGATSMAWRGKNVLQRNACIVLGNQQAQQAKEPLEHCALNHPSEMVREAAAWALNSL